MSDLSEVQATLDLAQSYFDAGFTVHTELFASIFDEDARLHCVGGEDCVTIGPGAYLEMVQNRVTPASRNDRRQNIVLSIRGPTKTIAHLRVSELFLPKLFTDELVFLRQDDQWRTVAKVREFKFLVY